MRRCLIGDMLAAAVAVADMAPAAQPPALARLIAEADAAHRHAKRLGRPHPQWGSGSLQERCLDAGAPPFRCDDARHLAALAGVAAALARRRAR